MADQHLAGAVLLHHIEKDVPARVNHGPIGVAVFADDFKTIRPFAERDNTDIVSWTEHPRGGHFAAMEVPTSSCARCASSTPPRLEHVPRPGGTSPGPR